MVVELFGSRKEPLVELEGKVAIVTGGAVRLGRAIALALADQRVKIALHFGHSAEAARATLDVIRSSGTAAVGIQADLREPLGAARTIVDQAIYEFGHSDILINSAAIFQAGGLSTTTEEAWDRHFAINLKSPFFLSQVFADRLRPGQRAQIVNIVDWRATRPGTGHLTYTLTKSALVTLTRSLAQELAPNVQVNAIAPGAILPPADKNQDDLDRLAGSVPLRRPGSPEEITQTLLFLLRSDFITGEIVHVTGGEQL